MKSIKQRLEENHIVGCIKFNEQYQFYLMPIAYWILNQEKYDPNYKPSEWEYIFRNNILNVQDHQINDFFKAIEHDKITLLEVVEIGKDFPKEYSRITFLIDFDKKEYINGFEDIEVEEYLPDESWTGKFDEPVNYLPKALMDF